MTTVAKYLLVWLLLAAVAVGNGVLRGATYGKVLPELAAHQLSTLLAMLLFAAVTWTSHRIWPIGSAQTAWTIGFCWLLLTVAFEFGFGRYVAGDPWSRLLLDYNLLQGRVWSLLLAWVTVLPFVVYRLSAR